MSYSKNLAFDQYARPIPKLDHQWQSFKTGLAQSTNITILFKYEPSFSELSSSSENRIQTQTLTQILDQKMARLASIFQT